MTVLSLIQSNIVNSQSSAYKKKICRKQRSIKLLATGLIFLVVALIISYNFQANSITNKNYTIKNLEKEISKLKAEHKNLQIKVSQLKSINALQIQSQDLDMVKAENVDYITISSTDVAAVK